MSLNPLPLVSNSSPEQSEIEGVLSLLKESKVNHVATDIIPHDINFTSSAPDPITHVKIEDHPSVDVQLTASDSITHVKIEDHKTGTLSRNKNVRVNSKALTTKYRDGLTTKTRQNRNSVEVKGLDLRRLSSIKFNEDKIYRKITIDLIRTLRNTYNCLIQAHANSDMKIAINRKGFLEITSAPSYEPTESERMTIQQDIYVNIVSALKSEIFNFFDDKGHFIDLKMFEGLVRVNFTYDTFVRENATKTFQTLYPQNKTLFEEENKLKKFLEKLCIPENEITKFTEHEIFCIGILQRLYPENTEDKHYKTAVLTTLPVFPPAVFLMVYKQFLSTPQLLKIIQTLLEWPKKYIPTFQKVRLMNFLRTWIESFSYRFEMKNYKDELMKILESGRSINFESMYLAGEIEDLIDFNGIPKKTVGTFKVNEFLTDILSNNPTYGHYHLKMIDTIADDLKILAAESISDLAIEELYSDKVKETRSSYLIYNDNVEKFIYSLFPEGNKNLEPALRFCFYLAQASLEKNDYFTAYVIYTCLSNPKIEKLYSIEHKKKNSYFPNLKKKTKKIELDAKTWEIHQNLSSRLAITNNRVKMNREMLEKNKRNILIVPELALIKSSLIRMKDEFEAHSEEIKINMKEIDIQTLHDTSDYKMKVESMLNNVLLFYYNSADLQTDIGNYLNGNVNPLFTEKL